MKTVESQTESPRSMIDKMIVISSSEFSSGVLAVSSGVPAS